MKLEKNVLHNQKKRENGKIQFSLFLDYEYFDGLFFIQMAPIQFSFEDFPTFHLEFVNHFDLLF